ncbi:hypothetical protein [Undibacterium sp. Ren11W]|uniref:hypothetical protein n=1 Tax=Undibacterium sp. Ren11W TaxID=3413045 RepID=UPI003BF1E2D0
MLRIKSFLFCAAMIGHESGGGGNAHAQNPVTLPGAVASSYVLTLQTAHALQLTQESLSLRLLDFKDSRCPPGVHCMWAGQATVTIQVTQTGVPSETLLIGTPAPKEFPGSASYRGFQFSLQSLEPSPTVNGEISLDQVRATVLIEKIQK